MKKGLSNVLTVVIVVVVLIAVGIVIVYVTGSKRGGSQAAPAAPSPSSGSGIINVGAILQDMVQSGSIFQSTSTVTPVVIPRITPAVGGSQKSLSVSNPPQAGPAPVGNVVVNSVSQSGSSIVANVTTISPPKGPVTTNLVFADQGGSWQVVASSSDVSSGGGGGGGGVPVVSGTPQMPVAPSQAAPADLIVAGVTVSPGHPVVNDPTVEIVVVIKNIGGTISDSNDSFSATLSGLAGGDLAQRNLGSLGPGQSLVLTFIPYKNNNSTMNDLPGEKTIQVTGLTSGDFTQSVPIYGS